jgi:hypothetical protein
MKIIFENKEELHIELPCGKITKISAIDKKFIDIFPSWRFSGGYVRCSRYIKTKYSSVKEDLFLHRLIMGIVKGFEIDHANRDKLDNKRENLRRASRGENTHNKNKSKNTTSKYRGVCYRPKINKKNPWIAYVSKNKKVNYLGYFNSENEAAEIYNKKAKELWGDFAYQNIISD